MNARIPKYQEALDFFCKNESWKHVYENAPNGAKECLEEQFFCSKRAIDGEPVSPDELLSMRKDVSRTPMKKEDWEYMMTFVKDARQKAYYKERIAACEKGEGK